MAHLSVVDSFTAFHMHVPKEHHFDVKVVVEGNIDPASEYTAGIDHFALQRDLRQVIATVQGNNLREVFAPFGLKRSVNESIARYFFLQLSKYPIYSITITEDYVFSATVFSDDVQNSSSHGPS